jgi:hypothetical protein
MTESNKRIKKALSLLFMSAFVAVACLAPATTLATSWGTTNVGDPCPRAADEGDSCVGGTCQNTGFELECVATPADDDDDDEETVECEVGINAPCGAVCSEGQTCGEPGSFSTCRDRSGVLTCMAADDPGSDTGTTPPDATLIEPRELPNPLGTASIPEVLARIITILTGVSGSVALLMFVYGGVLWLISGGNQERITTGKQAMVYATIGLTIIFGSYAILRALFLALGASL